MSLLTADSRKVLFEASLSEDRDAHSLNVALACGAVSEDDYCAIVEHIEVFTDPVWWCDLLERRTAVFARVVDRIARVAIPPKRVLGKLINHALAGQSSSLISGLLLNEHVEREHRCLLLAATALAHGNRDLIDEAVPHLKMGDELNMIVNADLPNMADVDYLRAKIVSHGCIY